MCGAVFHSPRNMVESYTAGPFRCGDAVQIKDGIVHAGQALVDLEMITAAAQLVTSQNDGAGVPQDSIIIVDFPHHPGFFLF